MHFIATSSDLHQGMNLVTRALLPRAAKLAYEGVFIETLEDGLQLSCTNGEMTIKTVIPAVIKEDGCALLPAKLLGELLSKLSGEVDIRTEGNQKAQIVSMESRTSMMLMEASDFPEIQDVRADYVVSMPQKKLRDAVSRIIFAVSADETRRILTGCLMETYPEHVAFVCLDGFRLAMQRVYVSHELPKDKDNLSAILPGSIIGEVARMMPDSEEPVQLHCSATHLMVSFGKTKVYCPLIPGEYINYKQILPANHATSIRVDRAQMMGAIERAALMAREGNNNLLKLKVETDSLTIQANAERGAVVERIPIDFTGSPLNIAFNARYLMDVIKNLDAQDMAMHFNTNVSPCVIGPTSGNQYTYLVLPVRVAE